MHGQRALLREPVVHHGEDAFLHLAAVGRATDDLNLLLDAQRHKDLAVQTVALPVLVDELARIDHGEVLLGDWGLARLNSEKVKDFELPLEYDYGQTTLYGYISGTPGYMAPEQCSKGKEKGTISDIYSLGALLVFMFCGEPPVKGTEKEKILGTNF